MVEQLLPNTNEMLQCILALQNLNLNTAIVGYTLLFAARLNILSHVETCHSPFSL
jgi:hypothetical protein